MYNRERHLPNVINKNEFINTVKYVNTCFKKQKLQYNNVNVAVRCTV